MVPNSWHQEVSTPALLTMVAPQSAGNGCDLMQQQEKFQAHAAGTFKSMQCTWAAAGCCNFRQDDFLGDQRAASESQPQALAPGRWWCQSCGRMQTNLDDLEGIPDEARPRLQQWEKHPPNLFGKESTSYANPFAPLKTNMDTKLFHA